MFKIRRSLADKYFSDFIRERDDWTCQRCKTPYEKPTKSLHCSHFHSRGKKSVRFDPLNACALCYGCHGYFTANPQEHLSFFVKRLGKGMFDALNIRASIPQKVDEKAIVLGLKLELKRMKNEKKVFK